MDDKSDIDANDLFVELKFLQRFMPNENIGPVEVLKFIKRHNCFPNASIAYRVLLTIPVTVAYRIWTLCNFELNRYDSQYIQLSRKYYIQLLRK